METAALLFADSTSHGYATTRVEQIAVIFANGWQ
jgi:hypothetical protein